MGVPAAFLVFDAYDVDGIAGVGKAVGMTSQKRKEMRLCV